MHQVVYNHPALSDVGTPDADDVTGLANLSSGGTVPRHGGGGSGLGDLAMLRGSRYAAARRARRLLLLPEVAAAAQLPYNEVQLACNPMYTSCNPRYPGLRPYVVQVQLRVAAQARCFIAPQGGASLLSFYQPGLHIVSDCTGKARHIYIYICTGARSLTSVSG